MPEETTINKTNREETKEKAKKESKRAIRKREKEKARKRLLNQQQSKPVTERVITRDAYEKRKDYKEDLIEQAAELYEIEEIYKIFAQKRVNNGNTEKILNSNIGDVISIQHTDESGEKTFSPPMEIEGIEKDEEGNITGYILRDMNGKQHILSNVDAVILPIMNKDETYAAYQKGKSEIEKEKEGPKKLQKRISQYQSDIEYANKDTSAWKDDYLKAPEKPKEQATGGKVKIDIANEDIKAVVEKCPDLVLDYMEENKINRDGLDLSGGITKAEKSAKILEYLGSQEFDKETGEKLSAYLKDKDKRFEEYKTKPLNMKSVRIVTDEAKFAYNAVPTNVQNKMKELGIIPKETKWMTSKALMDYAQEGDHLTFTQETRDKWLEYIRDKPARQKEFVDYMKKNQSKSR